MHISQSADSEFSVNLWSHDTCYLRKLNAVRNLLSDDLIANSFSCQASVHNDFFLYKVIQETKTKMKFVVMALEQERRWC